MPTLLAVNNYFYRRGGAEAVFLEHMAALEDRGWNVVPFAMQHPDNLSSEWSPLFAEEVEYGRRYGFLASLRNAGRVVYSLDARKRIAALIERAKPDIAVVHNIYHHLSPSILWALRKAGIPVVMMVHDLKMACPAYTMFTGGEVCERCRGGRLRNVVVHRCIKNSVPLSALVWVESSLHRAIRTWERCVDVFVVTSRFYRDKLAEWGFDRNRFAYVPNAAPARELEAPVRAPGTEFLYFGRLAVEKGLQTAIRAAAQSGCELVLAGSGPEERRLRELAAALNAPVRFTGFLDESSVRARLDAARAAVLMSEWYENAPKTILEAYAAGRPVIASDRGGNPELVRNGVTGFLVPAGNVEELARALRRMHKLPAERVAAMGSEARDWVMQEFSEAQHTQRMLDIYAGLGVA